MQMNKEISHLGECSMEGIGRWDSHWFVVLPSLKLTGNIALGNVEY